MSEDPLVQWNARADALLAEMEASRKPANARLMEFANGMEGTHKRLAAMERGFGQMAQEMEAMTGAAMPEGGEVYEDDMLTMSRQEDGVDEVPRVAH